MTLDQIVGVASSAGTCVAAVLAYLALRESSTQRKAAVRPQFAIRRQTFSAEDVLRQPDWVPKGREPRDGKTRYTSATLSAYNVGLGPAMQLSLKWHIDTKRIVDEINHLAGAKNTKVFLAYDGNDVLHFRNGEGMEMFVSTAGLGQDFDFSLPHDVDAAGLNFYLPSTYTLLISLYLGHALIDSDDFRDIDREFTHARLAISYSDIGGQKYVQEFVVHPHVNYFSYNKQKCEVGLEVRVECSSITNPQPRSPSERLEPLLSALDEMAA